MNTHLELENALGEGRVRENVVLAPFTTFKSGGPAQYYFQAFSKEDIINALKITHSLGIACRILGGVSNVIISDEGLSGLCVRNMYAAKNVLEETDSHVMLEVSSGYNMTKLANETAASGYEGFEYHSGLPGTLGGGIYMNSKWTAHQPTHYIGDLLVRAELSNHAGIVRTVDHEYFQFSYDYSIIQDTHEVVLSAVFQLPKRDPDILVARTHEAVEYRRKTQPYGVASSGCFFQNVDGRSAGKMIDELGLKGFRVGGAIVSDVHANFILNDGTATSSDVKKLIAYIKSEVKNAYGVELKEEVVLTE